MTNTRIDDSLKLDGAPDQAAMRAASGIWWMMHLSDDADRETLTVKCCLDESVGKKFLIVGGLLSNRQQFINLSGEWGPLLHHHGVEQPFHMRDFIRPHGRYCGMHSEMKIAFFAAVADLINKHKIYSLHVAVDTAAFDFRVPVQTQKRLIGPYAMAFLIAAMRNCLIARKHRYLESIAYLLDEQNKTWSHQVLDARQLIRKWESGSGLSANMGSVTYYIDSRVPALQAADAVVWSARRMLEYDSLGMDFDPLAQILSGYTEREDKPPVGHISYVVPDDVVDLLAEQIYQWLNSNEDLPPSLMCLLQ